MGGVSTTNNLELCRDAKRVQRQILRMPGFGLNFLNTYVCVQPVRQNTYMVKRKVTLCRI